MTGSPTRPPEYQRFEHPTPQWFRDAKLGIFIHWGAYSVPAYAEPIGPLGAFDPEWWYAHNPYAEWYYNTIRVEGSPAREHQLRTYGSLDYEQFLDRWGAERFDAGTMMDLVRQTGARYVVPTTKHHDGITLWDAPGTGTRNTVHRGPRRDLVGELRDAALAAGIRFGVYYSGGLDWHASDLPPITGDITDRFRPLDAGYAEYAYDQVLDLIDRYQPDVLWGDIDWPDAGKAPGPRSLVSLLDHFYAVSPEGVVNDRFGTTHWDFRTSEYLHGLAAEQAATWENSRGVGFSYGYNRLEDESHYLSGSEAVRHFLDVVSRGGNLLLNIGPTASGEVPPAQARTLLELGRFNQIHAEAIFGSRPLAASVATPGDAPWVRWTRAGEWAHAFVLAPQGATLSLDASALDGESLRTTEADAALTDGVLHVDTGSDLPGRVSLRLRSEPGPGGSALIAVPTTSARR